MIDNMTIPEPNAEFQIIHFPLPEDDLQVDTVLYGFMQYTPGDGCDAAIVTFTTSIRSIEGASVGDIQSQDQYERDFLYDIHLNWDSTFVQHFIEHLKLQGYTGIESEESGFTVCIAPTPELAEEGFDTMYPYL